MEDLEAFWPMRGEKLNCLLSTKIYVFYTLQERQCHKLHLIDQSCLLSRLYSKRLALVSLFWYGWTKVSNGDKDIERRRDLTNDEYAIATNVCAAEGIALVS